MIDIHSLTFEQFKQLPLVIEGESKEVRYAGEGKVVIRFKPTIYSFTQNRCAVVPGSDRLRLRATKIFVEELRRRGIRHAYREIGERFVLADLVMPHELEFEKYGLEPFTPPDLSTEEIDALPKAPPIEVIVKRYLTGTTKHANVGMSASRVRKSHPFYPGFQLEPDGALPEMLIRFDWRNPLRQPGRGKRMLAHVFGNRLSEVPEWIKAAVAAYGDRVADQVLPEQLASYYIDVEKARYTAAQTALAMEELLASKDIVFCDACLVITEDGTMVYGEISQDCGRYRHLDQGELDKDVWRSGGSSDQVLEKWGLLGQLLEQ